MQRNRSLNKKLGQKFKLVKSLNQKSNIKKVIE